MVLLNEKHQIKQAGVVNKKKTKPTKCSKQAEKHPPQEPEVQTMTPKKKFGLPRKWYARLSDNRILA
jgi:hypothetical protein